MPPAVKLEPHWVGVLLLLGFSGFALMFGSVYYALQRLEAVHPNRFRRMGEPRLDVSPGSIATWRLIAMLLFGLRLPSSDWPLRIAAWAYRFSLLALPWVFFPIRGMGAVLVTYGLLGLLVLQVLAALALGGVEEAA